ncbi:MAG: chromate transporter [Lachnospiraceae bacterium]|nr:chromate transporter [Lachnospiraceae bacterium]
MLRLLDLYWTYVKISMASFGGMSMVPLLNAEMVSHGWMTEAEVGDIVAIAEMTPGPLSLNCASFVGIRVAGIWGSLFANLGVLTPSLTIAFLVAFFYERFKKSKVLGNAMYGVRPAALGMIIATMITLSMDNYIAAGALYLPSVIIAAVSLVLLLFAKLSIPLTILASALLGILLCR